MPAPTIAAVVGAMLLAPVTLPAEPPTPQHARTPHSTLALRGTLERLASQAGSASQSAPTEPTVGLAGAPGGRRLTLADLPSPPASLAELLAAGDVSFRVGGPRPPQATGPRLGRSGEPTYDAVTQFRLRYEFDARCRWSWADDDMVIRVRYQRVELVAEHEIWLRQMPLEPFWESRLVLHELDHVRLSSDAQLRRRLEQRVRANDELRISPSRREELLAAGVLDRAAVETWRTGEDVVLTTGQLREVVNQSVGAEFAQIVELVNIRYQELDKQTVHGARPVPAEGPLRQWLGR